MLMTQSHSLLVKLKTQTLSTGEVEDSVPLSTGEVEDSVPLSTGKVEDSDSLHW